MATKITSQVITVDDVTYWINCDKSKPCYSEYLKTIINQVNVMSSHHSKLFIVRYDFRSKINWDDNVNFLNFLKTISQRVIKTYKLNRLAFVWCREHGKLNGNLHYHFALILNGHKIQFPDKISRLIVDDFALFNGSIGYVPNCYLNLDRGDFDGMAELIYRLSYLAKVNTKDGQKKQHIKRFGASRLKMKSC